MNPLSALIWAGFVAGAVSGVSTTVTPPPPDYRLQTGRFGLAAAPVGDFVFAAGGWADDGICDDIEGLDPRKDLALYMAPSISPRFFYSAAAYDGRMILVGGLTEERAITGEVEEFTPEGQGEVGPLPPLPLPVARAGVAVSGDRMYVIGGETPERSRTGKAQIYDFKTKAWSEGAELPVAREGVVVEKAGKIYAPGGYDGGKAIAAFQVYDVAADRWERLKDLPVKMSAHSAVIADDTLYTFGDYEVMNRTAACDLKTGEWALIDVGYRSSRHNAAVLWSNEVLVIGGNVSSGGPYLDYIQRFPVEKLAAAPRRPWTAENEPKAEPPPAVAAEEEDDEEEAAPAPVPSSKGPAPSAFELSGKPAPDFELELLDGSTFRLADQKDKVVVLDFWATWCPPCRKTLPHMGELAAAYAGQAVVFLGVSRDRPGDKDKIAPLLAEHKVPYPTGLDLQGLGLDYSVAAIPCVVLIGRDGRVQGRQVGAWDEGPAELRKAIDMLLAGKELPSGKAPPRAAQKAAPPARTARPRPLEESSELDPAFFTLKWRRDIPPLQQESARPTRLDVHVPPRRLAVVSEESLHVLNPADGEPLRVIPLPAEAMEPDAMDRRPLLVYLQDGSNAVVAALKTKYEVTERSETSRSYRTVETSVVGFSDDGGVLWTNTLEQGMGALQVLALPVAADRDYLVVATWNQLLLLNPKGEVKLDQPVGFREHWSIRPGADGKYEVVVRGEDVAAYEWNLRAGD